MESRVNSNYFVKHIRRYSEIFSFILSYFIVELVSITDFGGVKHFQTNP